MQVIEVQSEKHKTEFLNVARVIYKNDPVWVCPLDTEIEAVFDPTKNSFHSHGEITRWVLKSDTGKLIGRVAAFINHKKATYFEQPTGGMGFFECIEDKEAAFLLFDTCKNWLAARGMQAMDGPINFGENDKHWGLLIWGFTHPSMGMNYNPPYYQHFFEDYGFEILYKQITNHIDLTKPFPERFAKIADWVMKKPGYTFEHLKANQFDKYAADFMEIYNDAWQDFENFVPITADTIRESFEKMKPIMDEKIIWFAYFEGEPVGFIICIPDANQVLKYINGKLDFIGKLKFFYHMHIAKKINRVRIIIGGTKKAFQNRGIESALTRILQLEVVPRNTIKEAELSWVGDFNEKMLAVHAATGAHPGKNHATYRYKFQ